jgi:hypothetical protein
MDAIETGRMVIRLYLHAKEFPANEATSFVGAALKAGRCMDFGARIRRRGAELTRDQILEFARLVGLDQSDLLFWALPTMAKADVLAYKSDSGGVSALEEYVGVTGPFLEQVAAVFHQLSPRREELCALESVGLASYAPLTLRDHQSALSAAGYPESMQARVIAALDALQLLKRSPSQELREDIVYAEYVWGDSAVKVAALLRKLPDAERRALTQISAEAMNHPGAPLSQFAGVDQGLLQEAERAGFIDAARVVTSTGAKQHFAFSSALERQFAARGLTDALHERKLFVAHILFGHYFGFPGTGRIKDPLVLVRAFINRGVVGPASAITTDYPLLETHGIVTVRPSPQHPHRSYLHIVKDDVVRESLELLEASLGGGAEPTGIGGKDPLRGLWLPGSFAGPESVRLTDRTLRADAAAEVMDFAIAELRKQAARTTRGENLT